MTRLYPAPLLASLLLVALPLSAQPAQDGVQRDMDRLRAENSVLRRELKAIKSIVDGVQAKLEARPKRGPKAPALKIGVVDLGRVFLGYERAVSEEQINATHKKLKTRAELNAKKLKDLEADFKTWPQPEQVKNWAHYQRRRAEIEADTKAIEKEISTVLKARVESRTRSILTDIESAVTSYGQRHGYDLILKTDPSRSTKGQTSGASEGIFRDQVNAVLYNKDALDVTAGVIALLNNGPQADWFEPGPLVGVVYLLEQAGVSFSGRRVGNSLQIDCRVQTSQLRDVALLREALKAEPVARHYARLLSGRVEIKNLPIAHMSFELRLEGWRGGGAEEFCSLDRAIEQDASGALGRAVKKLRDSGLQVQGRSGERLHLTVQGPVERTGVREVHDLIRGELEVLGLKSMTLHSGSEGQARLELKFPRLEARAPAAPKRPQPAHFPVENLKVEVLPGRNVIKWSHSPNSSYIVVTQAVIEVSEGKKGSWRSVAALSPELNTWTHEVNDATLRRYRVVTRAEIDDMSPRVRQLGLTLPPADQRQVSAETGPLRSVPTLTLLPLAKRDEEGRDAFWVRVYRYDPEKKKALPPREFRLKVGEPIGGSRTINGLTLDYRTGAVLVAIMRSGGAVVAVVRWGDGRQSTVRSDDPAPTAQFPE